MDPRADPRTAYLFDLSPGASYSAPAFAPSMPPWLMPPIPMYGGFPSMPIMVPPPPMPHPMIGMPMGVDIGMSMSMAPGPLEMCANPLAACADPREMRANPLAACAFSRDMHTNPLNLCAGPPRMRADRPSPPPPAAPPVRRAPRRGSAFGVSFAPDVQGPPPRRNRLDKMGPPMASSLRSPPRRDPWASDGADDADELEEWVDVEDAEPIVRDTRRVQQRSRPQPRSPRGDPWRQW